MDENVPLIPRLTTQPIELDDATKRAQRKLRTACLCSLIFMIAEVIGGFYAGSLAIMTDAAHLLSDVAGFLISLFAIWIGTLPATSRMSYGFHRAEVLGAFLSVLFIWAMTGALVFAATERLREDLSDHPVARVNGKIMFFVALIGLCINLALMKILGPDRCSHSHTHSHAHHSEGHMHNHAHNHHHQSVEEGHARSLAHDRHHEDERNDTHDHDHDHNHAEECNEKYHIKDDAKHDAYEGNINVQAAYIHAVGDFVQSVGVCVAGALIWYEPKWQVADPIATFFFSLLVLYTTVGVAKQSIRVLMEGTPEGIEPSEIEQGLCSLPSVISTHDLHIWSLTIGKPSLSVHVVSNNPVDALHECQEYLMSMGIQHTTIQIEISEQKYPIDCSIHSCGTTK